MILGFEPTFIGREHIPFNSGMLQTIAAAFPEQQIVFYAAEGHLAELRADPVLRTHGNIGFRESPVPLHRPGDPTALTARHWFARTLEVLEAALAQHPGNEKLLIVLFSSKTPIVFAASRFARRHRNRLMGVQVVLHNNVNLLILGWLRWRWPWLRNGVRRLACAAALTTAPARVGFLVLETSILPALAQRLPGAAKRVDALPHPANPAEFDSIGLRALGEPVRIGFLGRTTVARGREIFRKLADVARHKYGGRMEFRFVGMLKTAEHRSSDTKSMPRADYLAAVSELHYILLALSLPQYRLVASGALIDALTWRKPVIVSATAYAKELFAQVGEIGFLCEAPEQFEAALDSIMALDATRYARQIEALAAARASRAPRVLAPLYRALIETRFGKGDS